MELGYFDPHLDLSHGEKEVVTVRKDVYYRNVVFFVQHVWDLVAFKGVNLVKTNLTILLHGASLEWYNSELDESDRDGLRKTSGMGK